MYDGAIKADACNAEWGNPSGHSFLNCLYFMILPWLYNENAFKFY
jgi:hypothetical protein